MGEQKKPFQIQSKVCTFIKTHSSVLRCSKSLLLESGIIYFWGVALHHQVTANQGAQAFHERKPKKTVLNSCLNFTS